MCADRRTGRRYYLEDLPLSEARRRFDEALSGAGAALATAPEPVELAEAAGRVTAGPVWAERSAPHYDAAAMDGVAVRSAETVGATETSPLRLGVGEQAVWVDTGESVPEGFDAVVMIEHVHVPDAGHIEIRAPAAPYQHVRPIGEDLAQSELVLPGGHRIRPQDLGALASAGVARPEVRTRPSVAVIPTGTELVEPGADAAPGEVIEFNSIMLAAQARQWGGAPVRTGPVSDDLDLVADAIGRAAARHDIVVVNAGSSAGSEDHTAPAVQRLGELAVHGVAVRPGHPVVLGVVGRTPVIGIPGYPVSALVTSELFVRPIIERCLGLARSPAPGGATLAGGAVVEAVAARKIVSPAGEDEFLRVRLGRVGGRLMATPIRRGAGVVMSLVEADGIAVIPRFSEGAEAGSAVRVELLRGLDEIERTVVVTGSHDMTLDLLANLLGERGDVRLASANVGSLGGLVSLERGEAHMAGTHLLDPETGEYNVSYVGRQVSRPTTLVTLAHRVQGLMVPPGNPMGLGSIRDLAARSALFCNRQRGSGTRVLFDYHLRTLGIGPGDIRGYGREEYTHLAVAAAVAAGRADAGLGIESAARAFGLGFVPIATERYDLAVPSASVDDGPVAEVLAAVRSAEFRVRVEAMGGYDTQDTGTVAARLPGRG